MKGFKKKEWHRDVLGAVEEEAKKKGVKIRDLSSFTTALLNRCYDFVIHGFTVEEAVRVNWEYIAGLIGLPSFGRAVSPDPAIAVVERDRLLDEDFSWSEPERETAAWLPHVEKFFERVGTTKILDEFAELLQKRPDGIELPIEAVDSFLGFDFGAVDRLPPLFADSAQRVSRAFLVDLGSKWFGCRPLPSLKFKDVLRLMGEFIQAHFVSDDPADVAAMDKFWAGASPSERVAAVHLAVTVMVGSAFTVSEGGAKRLETQFLKWGGKVAYTEAYLKEDGTIGHRFVVVTKIYPTSQIIAARTEAIHSSKERAAFPSYDDLRSMQVKRLQPEVREKASLDGRVTLRVRAKGGESGSLVFYDPNTKRYDICVADDAPRGQDRFARVLDELRSENERDLISDDIDLSKVRFHEIPREWVRDRRFDEALKLLRRDFVGPAPAPAPAPVPAAIFLGPYARRAFDAIVEGAGRFFKMPTVEGVMFDRPMDRGSYVLDEAEYRYREGVLEQARRLLGVNPTARMGFTYEGYDPGYRAPGSRFRGFTLYIDVNGHVYADPNGKPIDFWGPQIVVDENAPTPPMLPAMLRAKPVGILLPVLDKEEPAVVFSGKEFKRALQSGPASGQAVVYAAVDSNTGEIKGFYVRPDPAYQLARIKNVYYWVKPGSSSLQPAEVPEGAVVTPFLFERRTGKLSTLKGKDYYPSFSSAFRERMLEIDGLVVRTGEGPPAGGGKPHGGGFGGGRAARRRGGRSIGARPGDPAGGVRKPGRARRPGGPPNPSPGGSTRLADVIDGGDEKFQGFLDRIGAMGRDRQLGLAIEIFDEVEKTYRKAAEEIRDKRDLATIQKNYNVLHGLRLRLDAVVDGVKGALVEDALLARVPGIVRSSAFQMLAVLNDLEFLLKKLGQGVSASEPVVARAFARVDNRLKPAEVLVAGGRGYSVGASRNELARELLRDMGLTTAVAAAGKWEGDEFVVTVPVMPKGRSFYDELDLRTYLRALGWNVKVMGEDKDTVTLRINFGRTLFPNPVAIDVAVLADDGKNRWTIGRGQAADIRIEDRVISRVGERDFLTRAPAIERGSDGQFRLVAGMKEPKWEMFGDSDTDDTYGLFVYEGGYWMKISAGRETGPLVVGENSVKPTRFAIGRVLPDDLSGAYVFWLERLPDGSVHLMSNKMIPQSMEGSRSGGGAAHSRRPMAGRDKVRHANAHGGRKAHESFRSGSARARRPDEPPATGGGKRQVQYDEPRRASGRSGEKEYNLKVVSLRHALGGDERKIMDVRFGADGSAEVDLASYFNRDERITYHLDAVEADRLGIRMAPDGAIEFPANPIHVSDPTLKPVAPTPRVQAVPAAPVKPLPTVPAEESPDVVAGVPQRAGVVSGTIMPPHKPSPLRLSPELPKVRDRFPIEMEIISFIMDDGSVSRIHMSELALVHYALNIRDNGDGILELTASIGRNIRVIRNNRETSPSDNGGYKLLSDDVIEIAEKGKPVRRLIIKRQPVQAKDYARGDITSTLRRNILMLYSRNFYVVGACESIGGNAGLDHFAVNGRFVPETGEIIIFGNGQDLLEEVRAYPEVTIRVNSQTGRIDDVFVQGGGQQARRELEKLKGLDLKVPMEWHLGIGHSGSGGVHGGGGHARRRMLPVAGRPTLGRDPRARRRRDDDRPAINGGGRRDIIDRMPETVAGSVENRPAEVVGPVGEPVLKSTIAGVDLLDSTASERIASFIPSRRGWMLKALRSVAIRSGSGPEIELRPGQEHTVHNGYEIVFKDGTRWVVDIEILDAALPAVAMGPATRNPEMTVLDRIPDADLKRQETFGVLYGGTDKRGVSILVPKDGRVMRAGKLLVRYDAESRQYEVSRNGIAWKGVSIGEHFADGESVYVMAEMKKSVAMSAPDGIAKQKILIGIITTQLLDGGIRSVTDEINFRRFFEDDFESLVRPRGIIEGMHGENIDIFANVDAKTGEILKFSGTPQSEVTVRFTYNRMTGQIFFNNDAATENSLSPKALERMKNLNGQFVAVGNAIYYPLIQVVGSK